MSTVCASCGTGNRNGAMFCRGCLAKLPAFTSTGPAALATMRSMATPPTMSTHAPIGGSRVPVPTFFAFESRTFWIRAGVLALLFTLAIVGWYAWVTRRVAPSVPPGVVAASTSGLTSAAAATVNSSANAVSTDPSPARPAPLTPPVTVALPASRPVAAAEALDPGETLAPPGVAPEYSYRQRIPPQQQQQQQQRDAVVARAESGDAAPTAHAASGDPRTACAALNFIARARCEASQCARNGFSRHPYCDGVREQTRRDVARRDLTF